MEKPATEVLISAISVLQERPDSSCNKGKITWDLSSCVPSWGTSHSLIYTISKTLILYLIPGIFINIVYTKIIKALWRKNIRGKG